MSNFTYLMHSDNLIRDALLTMANANSVYPITNIVTLPISEPFRTTEGLTENQTIQIALPVAKPIDTIGLVNHNLTSSARITVNAGAAPEPDGTAFTTTITHADRIAWKILSSSESYRYWSIEIDDATNWEGFLHIGYIIMGVKTSMAHGFSIGWQVHRRTHVRMIDNEFSQPMVGHRISAGSSVVVTFHGLTDARKTTLDNFLIDLQKWRDPMIFWPDTAETEGFFGRVNADHTVSRQLPGVTRIDNVEFRSDSFDARILEDPPFWYEPA